MKNSKFNTLLMLNISVLLLGCYTDEDNIGENTATMLGLIDISDLRQQSPSFEMIGYFVEPETPFMIEELDLMVERQNLEDDDCEVYVGDTAQTSPPGALESAISNARALSAGDVITITGPTGSVGEAQQAIDEGQPFSYSLLQVGYVGSIDAAANGLIVDIPGDEFPAFNSLVIPDVAPFVLTSESNGDIDGTFTWVPSDAEHSRIRFESYYDMSELTSELDGVSEPVAVESTFVSIDCVLLDDGSFALPSDVRSQLQNIGITALPVSIGREALFVRQQRDVLIIGSSNSIATVF